jgi:DNA/RNA endonuclease YhcR with UshA esterase domain
VGFLTKDYLPFGFTDISQINSRPQDFEERQVKVKGTVIDTLKIPFINSMRYVIDDGTGEITVETTVALPKVDDEIAIIAIGNSVAIIGGESIGFSLREVKVLPEISLLFNRL